MWKKGVNGLQKSYETFVAESPFYDGNLLYHILKIKRILK